MLTITSFAKRFAVPLWPWYLVGIIFLAATNFITLEIPQLAKQIVNSLELETIDKGTLEFVALSIVFLGFLQIAARSLSRILIFWPGRKLEATSKLALFSKTMTLPQKFIEGFGMGDLISRLSNDLSQVRVFFAFAVLQIMNLLFLSVLTLYKMLSVHVTLTVLCLTPIFIMILMTQFVLPRLTKFSRENQQAVGRLTNRVTEAFNHVHVIQANHAEEAFCDRIDKENRDVYATNMKLIIFRTLFFPLLTSLTGVSQVAVLSFGGLAVYNGNLTVGDLLAFNIYLAYLAFPLTSLGIVISIYQRSKTALERLSPLDEEPSQQGSINFDSSSKKESLILNIDNLDYAFDTEKVLDGITLKVKTGERIGICGSVGSGKSTLFNLLTRVYEPPPGKITLFNHPIEDMEPRDLRNKVAYALQSAQLFSQSIAHNLSFGIDPQPSQADLEKAAKQACILDDIVHLKEGWETQIGEKGVRLSGGQKQRLALARLFIRDPEILLLDDVLSAVDNQTEAELIQYINESGKTALIASHRTSVLKSCDRVLLLDKGKIIDEGKFDDLAQRHPHIQEELT